MIARATVPWDSDPLIPLSMLALPLSPPSPPFEPFDDDQREQRRSYLGSLTLFTLALPRQRRAMVVKCDRSCEGNRTDCLHVGVLCLITEEAG